MTIAPARTANQRHTGGRKLRAPGPPSARANYYRASAADCAAGNHSSEVQDMKDPDDQSDTTATDPAGETIGAPESDVAENATSAPPPEEDPDVINADLRETVRRMRTIRLPRRQALEVLTNACCGDLGGLD